MILISKLLVALLCSSTLLVTPILASDTKTNPYTNQKPVPVNMTGYIYKQLAPGTTTNVYWTMFQDEKTEKIYAASLLQDTSLYQISTTKVKVAVSGTTLSTRQWPYNIISIKTLKGNLQKMQELLDGIIKKVVAKNGKVSYVLSKYYTNQLFNLIPKAGININFEKYAGKFVAVVGTRTSYEYNPKYGGDFIVSLIQLRK